MHLFPDPGYGEVPQEIERLYELVPLKSDLVYQHFSVNVNRDIHNK